MGDSQEILFGLLLPVVAFLYASVGHGGASGYLALMALTGMAVPYMKPLALILNLCVAGVSFAQFARNSHFKARLTLPFLITSIPAAFAGGMIEIEDDIYKKVLAGVLVLAVLRMLGIFGKGKETAAEPVIWMMLVTGALIGFVSGLIGIGGGIILSPVILLLGWGSMKQTAATSALFIWVNSAAGLAGNGIDGFDLPDSTLYYAILATVGGMAGGYFGSIRFSNLMVIRTLALVLVMASVKLLLT